jgi:hypothetical protein
MVYENIKSILGIYSFGTKNDVDELDESLKLVSIPEVLLLFILI